MGRCHTVCEEPNSLDILKLKAPEKTKTDSKEFCIRSSGLASRASDLNEV
jgi:hypothetical protein